MNEQKIPENAGSTPASTHATPAPWKPVIDFPSAPEEIPMPDKMTSNRAGCFPNEKID